MSLASLHSRPLLFSVLLLVHASAALAADAASSCAHGPWLTCGQAVEAALSRNPSDPKAVLTLATLWAGAFDKQYNLLRERGRLVASTPDAGKIFEEVKSKVDPLEVLKDRATDKALDAAVKRYLPRLAPLIAFAGGPIGVALKSFFNSSEVASDYDELRRMNDSISQKVSILLMPHLKPDWKSALNKAAQQAGPTLKLQ